MTVIPDAFFALTGSRTPSFDERSIHSGTVERGNIYLDDQGTTMHTKMPVAYRKQVTKLCHLMSNSPRLSQKGRKIGASYCSIKRSSL